MYNPYQGQPQNTGYQTGGNYYGQQPQQQQPQQPQLQQNAFQQQPQQQQPQMQTSYGTLQPQQSYGMVMNQPQQNSILQSNQLGGVQNFQQPQATQPQINQPQISQPQSTQPLQQQSTGYYGNMQNNQSLGSSSTAMQQPQLQAQGTGYYSTLTPSQPTVTPSQPTLTPSQPRLQPQVTGQLQVPQQPLLPQQTGFYVQQSQVPLEPLKPTATGFVNSFANNGLNNDIKIPAMRLSFITANDQAKFETLFRSVVKPGSNTITGTDCRSILLKSGLQPSQLAKIWALCDTTKAGELLFPEFALAMHLINNVLQGDSIPYELDSKTKNEVNSFIDAINLSIASSNNAPKTPFDQMITSGISNLQPQPTGLMPSTSFGMPAQVTGGGMVSQMTGGQMMPQTSFGMPAQITGGGMISQMTGGQIMPQTSFGMPAQQTGGALQAQLTGGYQMANTQTGNMIMPQLSFGQQVPSQVQPQQQMLQSQATGYLPPSNFAPTMPLMAQKTGFGNNEIYTQTNFVNKMTAVDSTDNDTITPEEKSLFYNIFQTYDTQGKGLLDSPTAVEIFRKSGLNRADLEHIWNLCDINNSGQLNKQEFALGMHLVYRKLNGNQLPNRLPPSLIPSSNQILDNVKNQLKNSDLNATSQSKIDALNFKNNDEENALPTFRNRRKTFATTETAREKPSFAPTQQQITTSTEVIESKYPPVNDVSSATPPVQQHEEVIEEASPVKQSQPVASHSLSEEINLIEKLQSELKNMIPPSLNSSVSSELQDRFEAVFARIPTLFTEINEVEKQITDAKINLFKLKNPSSITGTGANGEITENDRRKAKSRALLKSRMAALTGKQTDSKEEDKSVKFNEEIIKIRKESETNQEVIGDVKSSISEISASLQTFLIGKALDNENSSFEKWEFGIGLEPEIQSFVHTLNMKSFADSAAKSSDVESKGEDRTTYLKEQAQKRMKERLARFGLDNRSNDRSRRSRRGTVSAEDTENNQDSPFIPEESSPQVTKAPNNSVAEYTAQNTAPITQNESDSEDEEEKRLREELQKLKLKKKADKDRRLAELRKQLADAQAEDAGSGNEETSLGTRAQPSNETAMLSQQNSVIVPPPALPSAQGTVSPSPSQSSTPMINNSQSENAGRRNPFFRPSPATSTSAFDSKAAEAQRRIQRGISDSGDDDSDWSDDDNNANKNVAVKESVVVPVTPLPATVAAPLAATPAPPSATIPPVPIAPPIPGILDNQVSAEVTQVPVETAPLPVAPPIPSVQDTYTPPIPVAPPIPSVQDTYTPPIPVAPPIPSVQDSYASAPEIQAVPAVGTAGTTLHTLPPPPSLPSNVLAMDANNEEHNDDVLSIPESVDSETDAEFEDAATASSIPPTGIPPPPPLPQM